MYIFNFYEGKLTLKHEILYIDTPSLKGAYKSYQTKHSFDTIKLFKFMQ